MATIDELRQEPHWSYSALNTYLNICQAQFMYRYVDQAEVERTSVCFPFGKAFHSALTAQAWECMMGGSLTRDEIVDRFEEAFKIEAEATPNLIYKEGENFDTVIDLATKMLDAALANWSDYYTIKGVAQAFKVDVPGLDKPLIGEYDLIVQDGRDACIVDWKTSASRWPAEKPTAIFKLPCSVTPMRNRTARLRSFGSTSSPRPRIRDARATTPVAAFTTSGASRRWRIGRSTRSTKACSCRMKHHSPAASVRIGTVAGRGI